MVGPARGDDDSMTRDALRKAALAGLRWVVLARIVVELVLFAASVVLARIVPPAEFGRVAIALIVYTIAMVLAGEGFGAPLVQRRAIESRHVQTTVTMSLAAGAALWVGTLLLADPLASPLFGSRTASMIELVSPVFLLAAVGIVPQAMLQRNLRFQRLSVIEIAAILAGTTASVVLALAGLDAEALVIGALARAGVSTAGLVVSAPYLRPGWQPGAARELFGFGVPVALSALVGAGFRNVDYAILGAKLGAAQVGFYWRAFQIGVEYQRKITLVMQRVAFPIYSRAQGLEDMRKMRLRIVRAQSTVVFPLLGIFIALAPVAVPFIYGSTWEPAVRPAQLLAVAGMISALLAGANSPVVAAGRPGAMLAFNLARFAVYGLAVFLAAPAGLTVVCVVVVAVHFLALLAAQYFLLERIVGIPLRRLADDAAPATVGTLGALVVAFPLTRLLVDAGAPDAVTIAAVGGTALAAYAFVLRVLFRPAWNDFRLVVRRVIAPPKRARPEAQPAA
jgi:lipopolysaccharide exporter